MNLMENIIRDEVSKIMQMQQVPADDMQMIPEMNQNIETTNGFMTGKTAAYEGAPKPTGSMIPEGLEEVPAHDLPDTILGDHGFKSDEMIKNKTTLSSILTGSSVEPNEALETPMLDPLGGALIGAAGKGAVSQGTRYIDRGASRHFERSKKDQTIDGKPGEKEVIPGSNYDANVPNTVIEAVNKATGKRIPILSEVSDMITGVKNFLSKPFTDETMFKVRNAYFDRMEKAGYNMIDASEIWDQLKSKSYKGNPAGTHEIDEFDTGTQLLNDAGSSLDNLIKRKGTQAGNSKASDVGVDTVGTKFQVDSRPDGFKTSPEPKQSPLNELLKPSNKRAPEVPIAKAEPKGKASELFNKSTVKVEDYSDIKPYKIRSNAGEASQKIERQKRINEIKRLDERIESATGNAKKDLQAERTARLDYYRAEHGSDAQAFAKEDLDAILKDITNSAEAEPKKKTVSEALGKKTPNVIPKNLPTSTHQDSPRYRVTKGEDGRYYQSGQYRIKPEYEAGFKAKDAAKRGENALREDFLADAMYRRASEKYPTRRELINTDGGVSVPDVDAQNYRYGKVVDLGEAHKDFYDGYSENANMYGFRKVKKNYIPIGDIEHIKYAKDSQKKLKGIESKLSDAIKELSKNPKSKLLIKKVEKLNKEMSDVQESVKYNLNKLRPSSKNK